MKRVLITGANSYIGTSFEKYVKENYPNDYIVETVDMIDGSWRNMSFAGYDSIFHVAGIAHQKETKKNAHLYYEVNRDLAIETAQKAKQNGVKQFIFLSSMSVYGMDTGVITKETKPSPKSHYGKSKLEAEQGINSLSSDNFKVCILRPPMVYGEGCKGNYGFLLMIARLFPVLPNYVNQRSMLSIDKLCKTVFICMDNVKDGIYLPQDDFYVCTCNMIAKIRKKMGKKFVITGLINPIIWILVKTTRHGKKAFGNLIYDK